MHLYFHRMLNHQFGYETDSSNPSIKERTQKRRQQRRMKKIVAAFKKFSKEKLLQDVCLLIIEHFLLILLILITPIKKRKRLMWELGIMTLGYHVYNETFKVPRAPMPLANCLQKYHDKDQFWNALITMLKWLQCGFGQAAMFSPFGSQDQILDYSIANPNYNYSSYLKNNSQCFRMPNSLKEPLKKWFTPGWVMPTLASHSPFHNRTGIQPDCLNFLLPLIWCFLKSRSKL